MMEDILLVLMILSGNFSNIIASNEHIDSSIDFANFAKEIHQSLKDSISHGVYPYEVLEKKLGLDKSASLTHIMFEFEKAEANIFDIDDNKIKIFTKMADRAYNSNLCFKTNSSLSELCLEFNTNLFKISTAKSILSHYLFILKQAIQNPKLKISDFEMMTPEEIRLIEKFENSDVSLNDEKILDIFDTKSQNIKIHILDQNMKPIPIGTARKSLYFWFNKRWL